MSETVGDNNISESNVIMLDHDTIYEHLPQLVEILQACVNDEPSSLGFLAPLTQYEAERYWRDISERLKQQQFLLFILVPITDNFPTPIYGTVQLQGIAKATHLHRAEVMKLLVRPDQRMKGYATTLMNVVESTARKLGKELITLDTATKTGAMEFYRKLGYEEWGTCEAYASWSDGTRCSATFFRKELKEKAAASEEEGGVGVEDPHRAIDS
jgi:GNAT superfamily N-acetyltransferase